MRFNKLILGMTALLIGAAVHAADSDDDKSVNPVLADSLRLSEMATLWDSNHKTAKLRAIHSSLDCRIWQYIPGRLIGYGDFDQQTRLTSSRIGGANMPVVTSVLKIDSSPNVDQKDIEALREEVFKVMKDKDKKIQEDMEKATRAKRELVRTECLNAVGSPGEIILQPALVLPGSLPAGTPSKTPDDINVYHYVGLPGGEAGSEYFFDPNAQTQVSLTFDATDPDTENEIQKMVDKSISKKVPTYVGSVGYRIRGVTAQVWASIELVGKIDANFTSAVKNTHCESSDNNQTLAGAALVPGAAGAAAAEYTNKTTKCYYDLLTI
jgi:hypothetical protein